LINNPQKKILLKTKLQLQESKTRRKREVSKTRQEEQRLKKNRRSQK
jgi:hypothetical protein